MKNTADNSKSFRCVRSTNNENPVERNLRQLWLGIFPHYGFIDKRFLEIQETLRRVSFFVGDFGEFFLVLSCFPSR